MFRVSWIISLIIACCAAHPLCAIEVFSADFSSNPTPAGWTPLGGATWNGSVISPNSGNWLSPSFAVLPGAYYKFAYTAAATTKGYAAVLSTNPSATFDLEPASGSDGANPLSFRNGQLLSDNYGSVLPSASLTPRVTYFRAPTQAAQSFINFSGASVNVSDVAVSTATHADAAAWADTVLAGPLKGVRPTYTPPADRAVKLSRTFGKLLSGQSVKMAMLGDSISADTLNSTLDVLLERKYPGSSIQFLEATGHGTGMTAWNNPNATWQQAGLKLNSAVIDRLPDLVIIDGISNGGAQNLTDTGAIIDRIRNGIQTAGGYQPDILLMTGPVYGSTVSAESAYRDSLAQLAATKGVGFFDFYGAWNGYLGLLAGQGITPASLQRDSVHNNDAGKQALSRVMESYFTVPEPATMSLIAMLGMQLLWKRTRQESKL